MENAVRALEMAFAVFIFVIGLTVAITSFSSARETADLVLQQSDETTYYDYIDYTEGVGYTFPDGSTYTYDSQGNRIVGLETVIPTVYKYSKERYRVEFYEANYNEEEGIYSTPKELTIYTTRLNDAGKAVYNTSNLFTTRTENVYYFDIATEMERSEPWAANTTEIKKHLDSIFNGDNYYLPQYLGDVFVSYRNNNLQMKNISNMKFIEKIGRITEVEEDEIIGNRTTTKTIITYILLHYQT